MGGLGKCGVPIALCIVVTMGLLCMYWPLFHSPAEMKFFGVSDSWVYTGAVLFYMDRSIHGGEFPFWNPLVFCGQPIAGNPQYLLFYPPNLVRSALTLNPTPWNTAIGLAVMAIAHVWLAALGTYALARANRLSRFAAGVAGVVFVFSSAMTQRYFMHHHMVFVVAWLPWCWLVLDWAMNSRGARATVGRYAVLGCVFGMCLLAGSPGIAYFVAVAMLLFWAISRAQPVWIERRLGGFLRDIWAGALAIGIALGVASALVVPAVEFVRTSQRTEDAANKLELAPSIEGASFSEAMLFYPGGESHEGVKGIGVAALTLCVPALFSPMRRQVVLFAMLAGLLLSASRVDSALMLRVIGPLAPFPISSPGRMTLLAALPLALLAGFGIDRLLEPVTSRALRFAATGGVVAFGLFALGTLYAMLIAVDDSRGLPIFRSLFFAAGSMLAVASALWFPVRAWAVAVVAAIVLGESLYWQSAKVSAMSERAALFYTGTTETAHQDPAFWNDNVRDSLYAPNSALYRLEPQINGYDPLQLQGYGALVAPPGDTSFWRGVVEVGRWSDRSYLLMKRAFWLHREYAAGGIPERGTPFPVTTTVYIESPPSLHVNEIPRESVPRVPYSNDTERIALIESPIQLLSNGAIDGPTHTFTLPDELSDRNRTLRLVLAADTAVDLEVRLPEKAAQRAAGLAGAFAVESHSESIERNIPLPEGEYTQLEIATFFTGGDGALTVEQAELVVDNADENDLIHVVNRTANSVTVEVRDLPDYRVLSYVDFGFPGWRAYIDGVEAPLLRAFTHFKSVEVPPGSHTVTFLYRPMAAYVGIAVSVVAILAVAALLLWAFARGPRPDPGAP